jgi:hypothetical protein
MKHLLEYCIRSRLDFLNYTELGAVEQDIRALIERSIEEIEWRAGRSFVEVLADDLREHLRKNPHDLPLVQRIAKQPPPGEQAASAENGKSHEQYAAEARANLAAEEKRLTAIKTKISKLEEGPSGDVDVEDYLARDELPILRLDELITDARLCMLEYQLSFADLPSAKARDRRIDALAAFLAWLSEAMTRTTDGIVRAS